MVEHVKRLIRIVICQWKTVRILTNAETSQKLIGAVFEFHLCASHKVGTILMQLATSKIRVNYDLN